MVTKIIFAAIAFFAGVIPYTISGCVAEGIRTGESQKKRKTSFDQHAQ